nr:AgmX/PglI C-terminal domain-containing protein [Myxococcota bacterium]
AMATAGFGAALADDDEPGARAVEVATMLGDSVVDVKHCMDPRGGTVTAATWGFAAGGLACLLASATAFYVSVDTAATNRAALDYHTTVLEKPAYSYRPHTVPAGVDWLAFGGLALGLASLTGALVRSRRERQSPYYRIGTAANVQQAVEHAPSESFPLVAPSGDDFVFNYGAGMEGELILDGTSTPLAELAAAGRARPSLTTAGAIEVPIPARARIRARSGQTTFLVSAVARPRAQAVPLFANVERRTLGYVAGSLALHVGMVAFLQTIPIDDGGVSIELGAHETTTIDTSATTTDDVPPEVVQAATDGSSGDPASGGKMALEEGAAGKPDAPSETGKLTIKDNQAPPALSREHAIEAARAAGIMGSTAMLRGGIASLTGGAELSSGFDGADVYGPLFGAAGEGRGNFGFGRQGFGPGGGCGGDCGIVGTGRYGTIGDGPGTGPDGWGTGTGKGTLRKRTGILPTTDVGMPTQPTDGLDKRIIRRYVMRTVARISYCYESQLLANPSLAGTVSVQFLISPTGSVASSIGNGVDAKVASCVAGVVKNIEFPRPSNGGSVQVNYPFTFRAAGH